MMREEDGGVSASDGSEAMRSQLFFGAAAEQVWAANQHPGWRPGAMRPEERERLLRIGLMIVMGDRASALFVRRALNDSIEVGDDRHAFGYPSDVVLGENPELVLARDVEGLIDELSETDVAWGEQLPACPIHPGSHPLKVDVTATRITATCPVTATEIRSSSF